MKYKCPQCGNILDTAPRFCPFCGVEFAAPKKVDIQVVEEQPDPATVGVLPDQNSEGAAPEEPVEEDDGKIKPRTIVGFAFALLTLLPIVFAVLDVFMFGVTNLDLRCGLGIAASGLAFVFSIVTLAVTGKVSEVKHGKGFAITSLILGIILLLLSLLFMAVWILAFIFLKAGSLLEGFIGFDIAEYLRNFLLTGKFQ